MPFIFPLSVGTSISGMSGEEKQKAYSCDITYATNNELGFDYLRDNMAFSQEQKMQKELSFAIIDEVDSILIDEARTPLVISGPTGDHSQIYKAINKMIPRFTLQTEKGEGSGGEGSTGTFSWGGYFNTQYFADPEEQIIGILLKQTQKIDSDDTGWKFSILVGQSIDD